ncbi:hypothetical protein Drorol1_Dr00020904 [Drosera rotundifolia]
MIILFLLKKKKEKYSLPIECNHDGTTLITFLDICPLLLFFFLHSIPQNPFNFFLNVELNLNHYVKFQKFLSLFFSLNQIWKKSFGSCNYVGFIFYSISFWNECDCFFDGFT